MPPLISWSALADATGPIGVWGLGVEGGASLRRLRTMGRLPVLVDDRPGVPSLDGIEVMATEAGGLEALGACEVVVKSPGISRLRSEVVELETAGVAVCGGLGLFMAEADPDRVVCITGTKGKSTTTVLAVHLLRGLGVTAEAGGNIGRPPWDLSDEPEPDYWVIETSSFQVPDLPIASRVVAVTSLAPDHLDWHGTMERYYADKLALCTKPGVELVLANGSDRRLRAEASLLGTHVRWVTDEDEGDATWSNELGLRGRHNARNATLARQILLSLGIPGAEDDRRLRQAATGFAGLPSRCKSVAAVGPVEFIDDSLSTNVLPTEAALDAFDEFPVALLVGGHDRGVDYAPLGQAVAGRTKPTLVVTMPDNGLRIGAAVRAGAPNVAVVDSDSLEDAVATAYRWALEVAPNQSTLPGGGSKAGTAVVLLSPAAPSFGRFSDYRERAAAFARAAGRCAEPETAE